MGRWERERTVELVIWIEPDGQPTLTRCFGGFDYKI